MCHQPLTGCSPQAAIVCGQIKYSGQQQLARNSLFHHTATQHTQILECRKITEHIAPGKRAVCVYVWRPLLYLYPPSTVAVVSPAAKCSACSFPVSPLKWLTRRYQLASLSSNSFVWHVSTCRSGTSHSSARLASLAQKVQNWCEKDWKHVDSEVERPPFLPHLHLHSLRSRPEHPVSERSERKGRGRLAGNRTLVGAGPGREILRKYAAWPIKPAVNGRK